MQQERAISPQTVIAVVWDFDKTLIPGYMQAPLFAHYEVDEADFWQEVNQTIAQQRGADEHMISTELAYLNHIIDYVHQGRFSDLSNKKLRELGAQIRFCSGIPELYSHLQVPLTTDERFSTHGITLEHYVVSTGLRQMILGSSIAQHVDGVWGCDFLERDGLCERISYMLDNTTKTRALFEINKGVNKNAQIDVNSTIPAIHRRVPFENMIYLADGPSDVPVFSLLNQLKGHTCGVYQTGTEADYDQAYQLLTQKRVQTIAPADYRADSPVCLWLKATIKKIAERIVKQRELNLSNTLGNPPQHLN